MVENAPSQHFSLYKSVLAKEKKKMVEKKKRKKKREEPEVNNPMQVSTKVNLGINHPLLYASLPSRWFSKKCYKCPRQQKR